MQLTIPHLNCTLCEGRCPSAASSKDGSLIWPLLALLLEDCKQPFPVHPLLVTSDLIHLSHIPLLSFLSQPGEPLLTQKLFHTSDYPCCPSWYCFCVSCIPSELRGPDANTHLGCRHSMSLCDGDMLLPVLIFTPFLIIPNFLCASMINNKHCDDVFMQQTIRNLRAHSCEVAITLGPSFPMWN